jgi:hypothetical protein
VNIEHGKPTEPGLYAARQWYGWRILEWHAGEWWHVGRSGKWGSAEIEAFLGPLPVIAKNYVPIPAPAVMEFDL